MNIEDAHLPNEPRHRLQGRRLQALVPGTGSFVVDLVYVCQDGGVIVRHLVLELRAELVVRDRTDLSVGCGAFQVHRWCRGGDTCCAHGS